MNCRSLWRKGQLFDAKHAGWSQETAQAVPTVRTVRALLQASILNEEDKPPWPRG
jgi:hypothetical protein